MKYQKLLSLLVLLMTAVTGAWAQGPWTSGECTATLSGGTLTISKTSGSGAMADYTKASDQPWNGNKNSITSVVVGPGVTHIGNSSLRNLTYVTSVTLPEGLLTIGEYAFQGCTNASFTSITIPASVTSIGNNAFQACNKLTSVTIPASSNLTTIGNNAFTNCNSLGSITIPAGVTSIGNNAFSNCSALATVTFADGCNFPTISNYLFQNCSSLGSITIPASVTSIGNNAFQGCSALATVTFADGSNMETIGINAFQNCNNAGFTSITIPASVTSIGNNAFYNCTNLATVTFADGSNLTSIGNTTFNNCNSLGSIEFPASVTSIGNSAFYTCTNLATITLNSNPSIGIYAFKDKDGPAVTMNLTANSAGGANWTTFYNQNYGFQADANTEVFKVVLSGTELTLNKVDNGIVDAGTAVVLKTTGGNPVMTLTTSASSDTQDNSLTGVSAAAGATSDGTFYVLDNGASGLGFYKLASGGNVPVGNAYLTSTDESNFFTIGGDEPASNSCGDGLIWELNGDVLTISYDGEGTGAMNNWDEENPAPWFNDAPNIKYVEIADGVTSIGAYAFANCGFRFIDLPASVTTIGDNAFANIYMSGLTINSSECVLPQDFFDNAFMDYIYVPAEALGDYLAPFPDYEENFVAIPSVKQTDNVILWDTNLCMYILTGSPRNEGQILNYHNSQGGITITSEVGSLYLDDEEGLVDGAIVFGSTGKLTFTSTVGNITRIEIQGSTYDSPEVKGWTWTPGVGGDNGTLSWTGDAATVEMPFDQGIIMEEVEISFTIGGDGPEPAEVTVVFAANDKTVERTVTLPHTFKCNWQMGMDGPDELDNIIHELYNDYCYCDNNIHASGSDQVEAGTGENDNDFITIKGVFEGTATVTGNYATLVNDGLPYTLTISIKGDEPEPTTYTLQLVVNDPAMGSVAVTNLLGSGIVDNQDGTYTVPENAEVKLLATTNEGYKFTGWREGSLGDLIGCYYCGVALNTLENTLTFTMTEDKDILAKFEALTYDVALKEGTADAENWTVAPTSAAEGATVTLTYAGKKKVKSVKVVKKEAAAEPELLSVTVTDPDDFGIGARTIYYVKGETWGQAIANHPTENDGWYEDNGSPAIKSYVVWDLSINTSVKLGDLIKDDGDYIF